MPMLMPGCASRKPWRRTAKSSACCMGSPPEMVTPLSPSRDACWSSRLNTDVTGMSSPMKGWVWGFQQFLQPKPLHPCTKRTVRRPGPLTRLAGRIACINIGPCSVLLLRLRRCGCAVVESRFLLFAEGAIAAAKVIHHFGAAVVRKAFQIDFAGSIRFQRYRDSLLLHGSPHQELEPDLWSVRRLNDFAGVQDVAFGPGVGQDLLVFIDLLDAAQPFAVESDGAVVFAQHGGE